MTYMIIVGRSVLALLLRADVSVLRLCIRSARPVLARSSATAVSWFGNGFLYPVLAVILLLADGALGCDAILAAVANIGILHGLYPFIKKRTARPRPYRTYADLAPLLNALDEHSFPSGHVMTLTAALVPIVLTLPGTLSGSLALWSLMAWARLASAHHYPSDILAGTVLALVVSYPISHFGLTAVWSAL